METKEGIFTLVRRFVGKSVERYKNAALKPTSNLRCNGSLHCFATGHFSETTTSKQTAMNKGDKLNELLSTGEDIHRQMRQLFTKRNLATPDLRRLSDADRTEWYRLKTLSTD